MKRALTAGPRPASDGRTLLSLDDAALLEQCAVDAYRSSGPGGQKRNKTSSAIRLRHLATGLMVTASEDRSSHVNKARAVRRMRQAIALEVHGALELGRDRPSALLTECIEPSGGLKVGVRSREYLLVVHEILDILLGAELQVGRAASFVGVSTAQLVKFLRKDTAVWRKLNELRAQAGLTSLR